MESIFVPIALIVASYLIGCFSSARFLAKHFKSLKIEKVGTGYPSTENIYSNVSKPLGVLTGIVDFAKMYLYLWILEAFLRMTLPQFANQNWLLIFAFVKLLGHCLPVTNNFKGGRGIFTYVAIIFYFAFWPMAIVSFLAMVVILVFKQIRFAQYCLVLLPPFINFFFEANRNFLAKLIIGALIMGILNFMVSKKLGEI